VAAGNINEKTDLDSVLRPKEAHENPVFEA
jgi:hypothetical protein